MIAPARTLTNTHIHKNIVVGDLSVLFAWILFAHVTRPKFQRRAYILYTRCIVSHGRRRVTTLNLLLDVCAHSSVVRRRRRVLGGKRKRRVWHTHANTFICYNMLVCSNDHPYSSHLSQPLARIYFWRWGVWLNGSMYSIPVATCSAGDCMLSLEKRCSCSNV